METNSIIKHLLCDNDSLSSYYSGVPVTLEDIKRRLFLLERSRNPKIADHYYRLSRDKSFEGINSIAEVLTNGLLKIAEDHLELRKSRIHVKQEKQNDWQELITQIPPLILQAVFLLRHSYVRDNNRDYNQIFFNKIILPNARYTALPYPYISQFENFIERKNGFHDLHVHLNGTTETDIAWQDFLKSPDEIYNELNEAFQDELTKEHFEQESNLINPKTFRNLLRAARRIRNFIFYMLNPNLKLGNEFENNHWIKDLHSTPIKISSLELLIKSIMDLDNPFFDGLENPFSNFIGNEEGTKDYPMAVECLMYIKILEYLSKDPKESVSYLFHFYLLILGLANRLLVQQTHQYGFEQFKKHTVNGLREKSEKKYINRFLQLHGNELRNIYFLEGRFSPKDNEKKMLGLLQDIQIGWKNLCKIHKIKFPLKDEPQLKLIAHFIKARDKSPDQEIWHKNLRNSVWLKASVLAYMKENNSEYIKDVIGIDAAASEFDAPPEIFAPAFRLLRRRGFEHFTFHAGEDFYHILSGLRSIYESIEYFEMQHGDRIGHAVASGVDAEGWINNVGKKILIKQGEHLDNLIFVYHLIITEQIDVLKSKLPQIALEISQYSFKIYEEFYPVELHIEAWQLRKYCPMHLFSETEDSAEQYNVYSNEEWMEINRHVPKKQNDKRIEIIKNYNHQFYRKEYKKIIEIGALEIFNLKEIKVLQQSILKYMHRKEIVIETLPTSNVRIGHNHDFNTYHLWNWIKWEKEGKSIPPIVVGTDDSGIFATNIYNEYANIYCYLTCQCEMNHDKAMELIEKLDKNASIYKFT